MRDSPNVFEVCLGHRACCMTGTMIRDPEQLRAWQAAHRFKLEVYRLVNGSAAARDFRFRDQLFDAASSIESDIGEGFRRFWPAVICQFLTYALSSLEEATTWVKDGVDRGHFSTSQITRSLQLGEDCKRYMKNWWDSLQKLLPPEKRSQFRSRPKPRRPRNRPGHLPDSRDSSNSKDSPREDSSDS